MDKVYTFRELRSLDDLEKAVERQAEGFSTFRGRHHGLYRTMAKCIQPLDPILKIVQTGIGNSPFAPASAVFGAAAYLLQACTSLSHVYDNIEEVFNEMRKTTVRLKEYNFGSVGVPL